MVEQEGDMQLEDMAGADPMVLAEVDPMDLAEVAMDQAEAVTDLAMEGVEYQWAQWQPEQAPA